MNIEEMKLRLDEVRDEMERVIHGQSTTVDQLLIALLARGHVLIEGTPGLGKTLMVRALAHILGCESRRIQFTPDLMPTDVTGGSIYNESTRKFEFMAGPLFSNLVLADEINRATARTQSALLEAMQESSVTADGTTYPIGAPFMVVATQNPLESQGTFPLPDAQLDRFLFKVRVALPDRDTEREILRSHLGGFDASRLESAGLERRLDAPTILRMQEMLRTVHVSDELLEYVLDLAAATRSHRDVQLGSSPRGALALATVAQAAAILEGRDYVVPDDVKEHASSVLRHRLVLHPDAEFEGRSTDDVLARILDEVTAPGPRP